ncbi:50S ribosomal protein L6 [Candidatus Schneideria nysicola]|uniref:50S ribosomal protein L6 n=1 Tax=Candidatus Schneideria nysicola TaxID=1081631 RepID=UPI001CAA5EA3|nr:50S ribosomal protein L6 [Candidatus Schneideria nysicola]UAJ64933.1 50S ribosomal protein L6 [Candidatus Schneideria nysicola]UAJ65467.1 50S ribosomal protein L6 [Candidatus Schneideria nysicola]
MSRIAKSPITVPVDVEITLINNQSILIKGKKGTLNSTIHKNVCVQYINNQLTFSVRLEGKRNWMLAGTTRALLNNMILGVSYGFTKHLQLVGVGCRVVVNNHMITLSLGFSHAIHYKVPSSIQVSCPNQNEIILNGIDKTLLGQVAADLRSYRTPDPYKGKGIRYIDEIIKIKEAKKK